MCVWGGETPWKRVTHASPLTPGTHERLLPNAHMGAQQPTGPPPRAPAPSVLVALVLVPLAQQPVQRPLGVPRGEVGQVKVVWRDINQPLAPDVGHRADVVLAGQHKLLVQGPGERGARC